MRNITSPLAGFGSPFGRRRGGGKDSIPASLFANGEVGSHFPIAEHNGGFDPDIIFANSEVGSHFPIAEHNGDA